MCCHLDVGVEFGEGAALTHEVSCQSIAPTHSSEPSNNSPTARSRSFIRFGFAVLHAETEGEVKLLGLSLCPSRAQAAEHNKHLMN